jgi:hypothetical protein
MGRIAQFGLRGAAEGRRSSTELSVGEYIVVMIPYTPICNAGVRPLLRKSPD